MKPIGILQFLGTNCDRDVGRALSLIEAPWQYVWAMDHFNEQEFSGFVLPGGFSYGDYLRCGALASLTPAMTDIKKAAQKGKPILGICNGFQILCEAGLLPGALGKNLSLRFQDQWIDCRGTSAGGAWALPQQKMRLPIAHSMGRFVASPETIKKMKDDDQVWLRYEQNPNGSLEDIAGVVDKTGRIAALMPHPERAMAQWMGSDGGVLIMGRLAEAAA